MAAAEQSPNNQNPISPIISSTNIACFVASFLLEGLQRCSGILFSGTLELSDETRETAAIPFVVSRATAYISCVLAKSCTPSQKPESSLLFGTILCVLGAGLSFITNDAIWLTGCWGIIFGAGIGIAFPESLRVSQKFRSQTFLLVLHSAAPSFACMIMPYLMLFLISSYGLSGCLLVLSAVILNATPFILTSIYNINFPLTKPPKWRIRKKYDTSEAQENSKKASNGIDNEAFEPETSTQSESSGSDSKSSENCNSCSGDITPNGSLKIINHNQNQIIVKSHNVKPRFDGLDEVIRKLGRDPEAELSGQGTSRNLFERSFSEEDVLFEVITEIPHLRCGKTSKTVSNTNAHVMNSAADMQLQNTKRTVSVPLKHNMGNLTKHTKDELLINEGSGSSKDNFAIPSKRKISVPSKILNGQTVIHSSNKNIVVAKPVVPTVGSVPLKIKVHVVECTFTASELQKCKLFDKALQHTRKNGYRRHSNSLITSNFDNTDFSSPNALKQTLKSSSFSKCPSNLNSRMYLINEDEELRTDNNSSSRNSETLNELSNPRPPKPKHTWLKDLKKLAKPSCLVIIYAFVIYELTLITLLTIFDDLVTDAGVDGAQAIGVLPAFGLGGIVGRLSLKYFGEKLLLECSHAAAAILFILDGVVVTGILWSPNLYWIGGFYGALGFLEVGISTAIWNLVSDYIDEEVKSSLFSTCTLVCGLLTLFVPYIIGLSRDDLGEYDGLLQITSGLSVLCAILCYILPRFVSHSRHTRGS